MDFLTPPSTAKLEEIRMKIESSLPRTDLVDDAISVPIPVVVPEPPPPVEPPKPAIDLGDLTTPPTLQNYGELSPQGAAYLIELAVALEEKGQCLRALLAWERVLDLTKPDPIQAATAVSSIKRLRATLPDWPAKPEAALSIVLHAGTGKKLAKSLTPTLEMVARELEQASAGIVKIKTKLNIGKTGTATKGPSPVALWLAGSNPKSRATEVISFTADSPATLREEILEKVFMLIISDLSRTTAYTPPAGLAAGEAPQDALRFRVTRLCWSEFAATLNLPPKKVLTR
jgi:hypothetical protein